MSLREYAISAWLRSLSDRETEARAAVQAVLDDGYDVDSLRIVYLQADDDLVLYVFGDNAVPETFLSARSTVDGWRVDLVTNEGGWTLVAGPITSIEQLGEILDGIPLPDPDPEYPEWVPRHSPDGYQLGDRVMFEGSVWEVTAVGGDGRNTWRPDEYGWVKI